MEVIKEVVDKVGDKLSVLNDNQLLTLGFAIFAIMLKVSPVCPDSK